MKITQIITCFLDSNVFVVEKEGHCLIIDCAVDIANVERVVGGCLVDGILLTHGHYDHSVYCEQYAKRFNTKIYAHKNIKETLSNANANYSDGNFELKDFSKFNFIDKDCVLKIGEFDVECILAEGHSQCSICFKIGQTLFAGDVLFENGIGRTDLIGSNRKEMIKTLNKLEEIEFDRVFSGHGDQSDRTDQLKNIAIFKRFLTR